jgi:hypothetical protein
VRGVLRVALLLVAVAILVALAYGIDAVSSALELVLIGFNSTGVVQVGSEFLATVEAFPHAALFLLLMAIAASLILLLLTGIVGEEPAAPAAAYVSR